MIATLLIIFIQSAAPTTPLPAKNEVVGMELRRLIINSRISLVKRSPTGLNGYNFYDNGKMLLDGDFDASGTYLVSAKSVCWKTISKINCFSVSKEAKGFYRLKYSGQSGDANELVRIARR